MSRQSKRRPDAESIPLLGRYRVTNCVLHCLGWNKTCLLCLRELKVFKNPSETPFFENILYGEPQRIKQGSQYTAGTFFFFKSPL